MGSSLPGVDETGGEIPDMSAGDAAFPDNGDIVSGQYMYRNDSMDIDLYQFQVDQAGNFSAETIAQRLQDASLLNTALVLYNSQGQVVARNDDYYGTDSFINIPLTPGTYYIGVSASGNDQYDPDIANSGVGGTTEGPYDLRLNFQPQASTQLVDARGIALDGDADGTAGGEYNFWFNANTASTTAAQNHTLIVDKAAPTTAVTAWVKTSASAATCNLPSGSGLVSGKFDVFWSGGNRYGVTGTVVGNVLTLSGGSGTAFPASGNATVGGLPRRRHPCPPLHDHLGRADRGQAGGHRPRRGQQLRQRQPGRQHPGRGRQPADRRPDVHGFRRHQDVHVRVGQQRQGHRGQHRRRRSAARRRRRHDRHGDCRRDQLGELDSARTRPADDHQVRRRPVCRGRPSTPPATRWWTWTDRR